MQLGTHVLSTTLGSQAVPVIVVDQAQGNDSIIHGLKDCAVLFIDLRIVDDQTGDPLIRSTLTEQNAIGSDEGLEAGVTWRNSDLA